MDNNNKLVSVIIPVYNAEEYLDNCINSVLQQTYNNLQIILIDDGSTDKSGLICDKYSSIDSRIQVIHSKNEGSVSSRKKGLAIAKGEYVGFVDSDDYINKDLFSVLVNVMNETDSDFVHSGYYEVNGESTVRKNVFPYKVYEIKNKDEAIKLLKELFLNLKGQKTMSSSIWSKIFKKDLICKCFSMLDNSQQIGEDGLNLCRCIMESKRFTTIPECAYYYVIRNNSLSHIDNEGSFIKHISFCDNFIDIMKEYEIDTSLKNEMFEFCKSTLLPIIKRGQTEPCIVKQYYFPNINKLKGKRIIIYGAGMVGQDVFRQIKGINEIKIVCWVDKKFSGNSVRDGVSCLKPGNLLEQEYDNVLIALEDENMAETVKNELKDLGIDEKNIIWEKIQRYF